jgi:hypothetical protein
VAQCRAIRRAAATTSQNEPDVYRARTQESQPQTAKVSILANLNADLGVLAVTRKIPPTGRCYSSLYERTDKTDELVAAGVIARHVAPTTTLAEVVAESSLKPLSPEDEEKVRDLLGITIGAWETDTARLPVVDTKRSKTAAAAKGVLSTLKTMARNLSDAERLLGAHRTGFQDDRDIQVLSLIKSAMRGLGYYRDDHLSDLCQQLHEVTEACQVAMKNCEAIPGKPGRDQFNWYADFTRALIFVAEKNGITPTVIRNGGLVVGRFVNLAEAFERLCPPGMRSPGDDARGKRLERAPKALHRPY